MFLVFFLVTSLFCRLYRRFRRSVIGKVILAVSLLLWTNHVASKARAGVVGSTFSILKLIVGAGSFVLPAVCASIGYVGLTLTLVVLASLAFYCSFLVVGLKQKHAPKVYCLCDYFCCFDVCFAFVLICRRI
jgi:hypothetical protein